MTVQIPSLDFVTALASAHGQLATKRAQAAAGTLPQYQSATVAVPAAPTAQELTDYPDIRGVRILANGAKQAITWNRVNTRWDDVGLPALNPQTAPAALIVAPTPADFNNLVNLLKTAGVLI
jgi:hypothetical protein